MTGVVKVRVTYECGRCGNIRWRTYVAEDGLLTIPQVYCGKCVSKSHFTPLSTVISKAEVVDSDAPCAASVTRGENRAKKLGEVYESADKETEVSRSIGRDEVPESGPAAETAGKQGEGRESADASGGKDPVAGIGSAGGVPKVAARSPMPGKQVK